MGIYIKPINLSCAEELLEFEITNRKFFEKTCPSRGNSYYELSNFKNNLKELIKEQNEGLIYMCLVYDKQDKIVGRVNLVNIENSEYKKAELGYRIGEVHQGKGYATEAIRLIIEYGYNKCCINKIEAGTSAKNIASQNVLIKNDFKFVRKQEHFVLLNGEWHDSVEYEKVLTKSSK